MRPAHFLSVALLSTTISAWSLDSITENKAVQGIEHLFKRDSSSSSSTDPNAPTATESNSSASSTDASSSGSDSASASSTGSSKDSSSTGSSSGSATSDASSASSSGATTKASGSSGSAKSTDASSTTGKSTGKSSGKTSATSTKTYGNSVGYGGITMITPNVYSSSSYYKIGEYVTFAWNYTSLSVTPTAIDILATCTANSQTYTIAMNQTVGGSTGAITWDTQSTGTVPLLTETYTLMIHDAQLDVSATPSYGHLSAYTQHVFAMYTPQPYTGLNEGWKCVTCSGAMSSMERQTLGFMFAMAAVAIASFTLFAGNFGVI